jgi:predicted  nucleic acid-binding Zn-ribbon protein
LSKERAAIVASMGSSLYQRYERVRKTRTRGGQAVAEAVDGRCSACNIALRLQFFQDLKKGDQILACESCQRILYYNPPVQVEDLANEPARAAQ